MSENESEKDDKKVDAPDLAAEVEKWKALSRKNEQRAKDNEDAAKRLAELEDAQKSELEKILARAEAAEKQLAEREQADRARALADEVAKAKGVPAGVLRGSTREELEAHADEILALIPPKPKAATDKSGGERGEDINEEEASAADIAQHIRI